MSRRGARHSALASRVCTGERFRVDPGLATACWRASAAAGLRDREGPSWVGGGGVGREVLSGERDFFRGEGSGWVPGWGFDGVDFADWVDGGGAVADGEFHGAGGDARQVLARSRNFLSSACSAADLVRPVAVTLRTWPSWSRNLACD
jgi:hypothetical protein